MNIEVTSPKKFVQVPIEKLNGLGLTPTDKIIFGSIYTMINVTNICFMSNSKLAEDAEVSTRQVTRAITKLKEAGLIDVQLIYKENSKQVDKRYITLSDKYLNKNSDVDVHTPQTKSREGVDTGVQGVPTKSRGGIDIDVQGNRLSNISINRLNNNKGEKDHSAAKEIIAYLNQKLHKKDGEGFRNVFGNYNFIEPRLKDYSVDDLKQVIDNQVDDWGNNDKMRKFIRPETLFKASKIESYLNATPQRKPVKQGGDNIGDLGF